jgi:peptide/nickel transport system substrate-binding protein
MSPRSILTLACAAVAAAVLTLGSAGAQPFHPAFTAATNGEPDVADITMGRDPPTGIVTLANVFEQLWGFDKEGKVKKTVADWSVDDGGKEITIKLHPGVKFQTGDELTADDVIFSWKRTLKYQPFFRRHGGLVSNMEKLDKYTVRFTFKHPDVDFFDNGGAYLESKAYFDRVGEKEADAHPAGIGPYAIVDFKPGQYIDLKRFDGYYGKKPEIASARIYFIQDDSTRVAKLRAGEVDMITATPYPEVAHLKDGGYHSVFVPAHPTIAIQFGNKDPNQPWNKLKVRLAIAHAIDAQSIIKNLLYGIPHQYAWLAPGEWGYDPAMKSYAYDPQLAKKLLAEAGYPNGFSMKLYYTDSNYYGLRQTVEAVTLYLQQVGIKATVDGISQIQLLQMLAKKNKTGKPYSYISVVPLPVANTGSNPLEMLTLAFWSQDIFSAWKDPAYDEIVDKARETLDDAARKKLVMQAVQLLHDKVAAVPIWDGVYTFTMSKRVQYAATQHRLPSLKLADITLDSAP